MEQDGSGGWRCSACGHNLHIERLMQMEAVIRLADIPGISFSGAGMGVEAMALYIRNLELRWMEDQRRIRDLERALDEPVSLPVRRGIAAL